jgi:hypothetical protein
LSSTEVLRFVGGLEDDRSRIPLFRVLIANLDEIVDVVFVVDESSVGSEVFFLPILSNRAKFFRVNRAGAEGGRVVRRFARFTHGWASSSLSSCRFRDGGFAETRSSGLAGVQLAKASGRFVPGPWRGEAEEKAGCQGGRPNKSCM